MDKLRKERGSLKGQFTRKVKAIKNSIGRDDHYDVVGDLHTEINVLFTKLEQNNDNLVDLATEESDLESFNNYITECEDCKLECNNLFFIFKDSIVKAKAQKENLSFNIKKISSPDFNGDMSLYPTFRSDYKRIVEPRYGEDSYILRQCLSESVIKQFNWVDDYKLNWERLDSKFGASPKVIDYVIDSIKNLKPVAEGNNVKLIEMINTIERGWFDLKRLNKESEIENEIVISHIERLLPGGLLREWAIKRRKLTNVNEIFKKFMDFLSCEKDTLEYMGQNVRKNSSFVKSNVNLAIGNDNFVESHVDSLESNDKEYMSMLQSFQEGQNKQNQMVNDSLYSLSTMINNLTIKKPNSSIDNFQSKFCVMHNSQTHNLVDCILFKRLNHVQKLECLRKHRVCYSCLRIGHVSAQCINRKSCDSRDSNGNICRINHHPILHENNLNSGFQFTSQHSSVSHVLGESTSLLPIAYVYSHSYPICTLYDSGADLSLITHDLANRLGLDGYELELTIIKVGNVIERIKSKCYKLLLSSVNGFSHNIKVYGLDQITSSQVFVNMNNIAKVFQIDPRLIERPQGKVELLIGVDNCSIMPQVINYKNDLQLLKNCFGYCVRGIMNKSQSNQVNHITFHLNHVVCNSSTDIQIEEDFKFVKQVNDFFTVDYLGTECSPKCGQCKCGNCSFGSKFSVKEQREMELILEGLKYDSTGKIGQSLILGLRIPIYYLIIMGLFLQDWYQLKIDLILWVKIMLRNMKVKS